MTAENEAAVRAAVDALVAAVIAAVKAQSAPVRNAPERLHDIGSVAAHLDLGRSFIYREIAAGRLQVLKCGRRTLVSDSAITAYIAARTAASAPAAHVRRGAPSRGGA